MFRAPSSPISRNIRIFAQIRWRTDVRTIKLEPKINEDLENECYKPKHHPGRVVLNNISVPERIVDAIKIRLEGVNTKQLLQNSHRLDRQLLNRQPPLEKNQKKSLLKHYERKIAAEGKEHQQTAPDLTVDPVDQKKIFHSQSHELFNRHQYNWQPTAYDENKALEYMLGRAAKEYAALLKIFHEIKRRDPDFKPQSFFDFGSGVGTGTWAAAEHWRSSLFEYFLVDQSRCMNDLAELILRDGRDNKPTWLKSVFFRQFLPESSEFKSHLVISAFTLMELPDAATRMKKLLTLWNKCDGYLVLVENGTVPGFQLITEAREFLLQQATYGEEPGYIFAPCPHEQVCPHEEQAPDYPCCSSAKYHPIRIGQVPNLGFIKYSYVVFKKGNRDDDKTMAWPRIVRPVLVRPKHVHCNLCTHRGKLERVVLTKRKNTTYTYRCAKKSDWGDRLPIEFTDEPIGTEIDASDWTDD